MSSRSRRGSGIVLIVGSRGETGNGRGGVEGGLFCMSSAIDVAGETACSVLMKDEKLGDYGRFCSSALVF